MKKDFNIPRVMSTQHPDNASLAHFASGETMGSEDEVREAFFAFKTLGCDEQMWDHEGKEVDQFVVQKLLSKYGPYFRKNVLGKNVRLTLRVPNPSRERGSSKVLLEVLESIPRSYDIAKHFYHHNLPPIFEVILPMTTNSLELSRIWHYYRDFVVAKSQEEVIPGDITLKEWIGEFAPKTINVIPLIEDKPSMLTADDIVEGYIKGKPLDYQRVFLARSDPALTYGSAAAVLMIKIALNRLHKLEKKVGIPIYPIVGVGTAPFRGHFNPTNIKSCLKGYPSVQTFTVQSAFKFDYPEELVKNAIQVMMNSKRKGPIPVDKEERVIKLINKISRTYQRQVELLIPIINEVSHFIPSRRKRKLHVGLFGYTRAMGGKRLPRAIGFCAALYSIGLPPELLGLSDLTREDIREMQEYYPNFMLDLVDCLHYFDENALKFIPPFVASGIRRTVKIARGHFEVNLIHQSISRAIREALDKKDVLRVKDLITQAARERKFLG